MLELCSSFTQSESFDDFTSDFSISPNPATDQIVIENSKNRIDLIQIYNLFGQQIFSSYLNPTEENFSINCENFSRGIYFVKATFDSGSVVKKILIE